ncbi:MULTISPECIES: efflux RND transporter periplasmic adaptor subunit [Oceanobacillus]|uniref:HlyD family efflux transporter periplasmic adaptor subunit n=1 Tax=Oceanobacillus TaxID=182709 RepID=UPI00034B9F5C|nr:MULTISPECIES: efflux RND transporter periplasmic adaptor subunit [Oceanobacillus]MBT2601278.1 efflux RND transporter periplasmic adaptor subunit [Oceanobacillus sp. ISL-74]MBT2653341.1 efflux RND transporter periplasmic adaptor subunit [Oceanobacillus sp. ISL-73]
MRKYKKHILWFSITVFVVVNFVLVLFDKEEKIDRVSFVHSWTNSHEADLVEMLYKPGVIDVAGEEHIYFDTTSGVFQEFMVQEGDMVTSGEPLFSYEVQSYYETEVNLNQQVSQVEGELAAIQSAITQMEMFQIPEGATGTPSDVTLNEEELEIKFPQNTVEAELLRQQYLIEKENELSQKTAELQSLEAQLMELQSSGNVITVNSPFDGRISEIKDSLEDPVITIQDTTLQVDGEFTEEERTKVEAGLATQMEINELPIALEGTINEVSDHPKEVGLESASVYPFSVSIAEEDPEVLEALLPGYHAEIGIIMEEALSATTLFEDSIFTNHVWKLHTNGQLMKSPIETGLHVDEQVEVVQGVEVGDVVANQPSSQFRHEATFITPIQVKELSKSSFTWNQWARSFVTGILSR